MVGSSKMPMGRRPDASASCATRMPCHAMSYHALEHVCVASRRAAGWLAHPRSSDGCHGPLPAEMTWLRWQACWKVKRAGKSSVRMLGHSPRPTLRGVAQQRRCTSRNTAAVEGVPNNQGGGAALLVYNSVVCNSLESQLPCRAMGHIMHVEHNALHRHSMVAHAACVPPPPARQDAMQATKASTTRHVDGLPASTRNAVLPCAEG